MITREFPITYDYKIKSYDPQQHLVGLTKKAKDIGPEQGDAQDVTLDDYLDLQDQYPKLIKKNYDGMKQTVTEGEMIDGSPCPESLQLTGFSVDGKYIEPCTLHPKGGFLNNNGAGSTLNFGERLPTIAEAISGMTAPQYVPLGRHTAIYDRIVGGYDIPLPEEDIEGRGIGDFLRQNSTIAITSKNGSVYLPAPVTLWGKTHPAGWNACADVRVLSPYLFLCGSKKHETCWGGLLHKYPYDVVATFRDLGDLGIGWIGHKWESSDLQFAEDVWYSRRSPLENGEHTQAMCDESNANGCGGNIWNRCEQAVTDIDPQHNLFKRVSSQYVIYFEIRNVACSREITLVEGMPSIIPALAGLGIMTAFAFLGPVLGAAAAASGAGAGRRTPRRKT